MGFLLGGINYEGGRSNQTSSFMRGVIVPPSKLIVDNVFFPPRFFLSGGFIIKGVRLVERCLDRYTYKALKSQGSPAGSFLGDGLHFNEAHTILQYTRL